VTRIDTSQARSDFRAAIPAADPARPLLLAIATAWDDAETQSFVSESESWRWSQVIDAALRHVGGGA